MKRTLINLTTILSVLPVLLVMISLTASAQTSNNYNLSAYKLPEIRYQELETVLELSGTNNTGEVGEGNDQQSRYFNGNAGASYYSFLNSAKIQRNQHFNLYLRGNSSYSKNDMRLEDQSDFQTTLDYSIRNKRYFRNKTFFGTGLDAKYRYGRLDLLKESIMDTLIGNVDTEGNSHLFTVGVPLKFGIGRIEQVQDYQEAIYIYEDLLKIGRAVSGKSGEEVMELATLISRLKSKRFFDARINNIQNIEALDSFLVANNFKTISDAGYFATLVDNWNFVNHFQRNSGTSIALTVIPDFRFEDNKQMFNLTDLNYHSETKTYGLNGGITFEHYKPINLYWQANTYFSANAGYMESVCINSDTIRIENSYHYPVLNISFQQSVNYYPNTRTQMSAGIYAYYNEYFEETDDEENITSPDRKFLNSNLYLSIDYYISPKLRLDVNTSLAYSYSKTGEIVELKSKSFSANFGARLAYSIF